MVPARGAAIALQHVCLLLMMYAGACLVLAARLRWDPTAYVPLRAALHAPGLTRALAGAALAAGLTLAALAHLAVAALALPERRTLRRGLLYTHAALMVSLVVAEAVGALLAVRAARAWLRSAEARQLLEALELREHLAPLLAYLARWHPLPEHLRALIDEVEADVPRNGYAACGTAAALAALQLASAALAACAARPQANSAGKRAHSKKQNGVVRSSRGEAAPLRSRSRLEA